MSAAVAREWRRFTPRERAVRYGVYLGGTAAVVAAARSIEIVPEFLRDTPAQVADLVVDAVREDRFWILTHDDTGPAAVARMQRAADGVNPTLGR